MSHKLRKHKHPESSGSKRSKSVDSENSEEFLETITLEDLHGVWLHSNHALGKVIVDKEKKTAKMGALPLKIWEQSNTVCMQGWSAIPSKSTSSTIYWTGPAGTWCTWAWEGDEEDVASSSHLLHHLAIDPRLPAKRQRKPATDDLIIHNPRMDSATARNIANNGKRRKGPNGNGTNGNNKASNGPGHNVDIKSAFSVMMQRAGYEDDDSDSDGGDNENAFGNGSMIPNDMGDTVLTKTQNLPLEAARGLRKWLMDTNTPAYDEFFLMKKGMKASIPNIIIKDSGEKEEFIALVKKSIEGILEKNIEFLEQNHAKNGNIRVAISSGVREKFAQKNREIWRKGGSTAGSGGIANSTNTSNGNLNGNGVTLSTNNGVNGKTTVTSKFDLGGINNSSGVSSSNISPPTSTLLIPIAKDPKVSNSNSPSPVKKPSNFGLMGSVAPLVRETPAAGTSGLS